MFFCMNKEQQKRLRGLVSSKREKEDYSAMSAEEISDATGIDAEEIESLKKSSLEKITKTINKELGTNYTSESLHSTREGRFILSQVSEYLYNNP